MRRIMWVEDDQLFYDKNSSSIQTRGFTCDHFTNPDDAHDALLDSGRPKPISLILDVALPKGTRFKIKGDPLGDTAGIRFISDLRTRIQFAGLGIFVFSSREDAEAEIGTMANRFFSKNVYSITDVLETIERWGR